MSKFSQRFKSLSVLVGVPSNGTWHADFGMALCSLMRAFMGQRVGNFKEQSIQVFSVKGSILSNMRWECVKEAVRAKCDYLFFVDTDQTFPKSTLHHLIGTMEEKGIDVIAANIVTKQIPASTTARLESAEAPLTGIQVFTDPTSTGIEKVWRVGTGVMLLSKKAFSLLRGEDFALVFKPEADQCQGEDWAMCAALDRLGIPIYIDHDLSKLVTHIGFYKYTHDVVGEVVRVPEK